MLVLAQIFESVLYLAPTAQKGEQSGTNTLLRLPLNYFHKLKYGIKEWISKVLMPVDARKDIMLMIENGQNVYTRDSRFFETALSSINL